MEADALHGVVGGASANTVRFEIPGLPGSLNQLYELNRPDSGLPRKRLRAEWAIWKSKAKVYVPRCDWAKGKYLRIEMDFESPSWFYKNGGLRRRDVDNLEKLVLDTVFEKLDCDDSYVIEKVSRKSIGDDEKIIIRLEAFGKAGFMNL